VIMTKHIVSVKADTASGSIGSNRCELMVAAGLQQIFDLLLRKPMLKTGQNAGRNVGCAVLGRFLREYNRTSTRDAQDYRRSHS